jgi:ornithine cyclodeaminase/alanine dehydrogenase-like protein (mu-crystallin family)
MELGHERSRPERSRPERVRRPGARTLPAMATPAMPPLRYLNAAAVEAAMPDLDERLRLAELTMTAVAQAGTAELPAKIAVHPRPEGSFAHAMPAHLRGADEAGTDGAGTDGAGTDGDLLGIKWIAGFGTNSARGLPVLHGLVVLNDALTGVPTAILDAGPITAQRTAAVSGVAIRRFAPVVDERALRAALIGAGVQGRSHLPVLGRVLPGVELSIFDRHPDRADALAREAESTDGIARSRTASGARQAVDGADVVVTAASFAPPGDRQVMTNDWLLPWTLVVPIDYATFCAAEVARDADLFLVDHRDQFLANRDAGLFDGYPDPAGMLGEAILARKPRPEGKVVVSHLGVGLADVIFSAAILRTATERGLGTELAR